MSKSIQTVGRRRLVVRTEDGNVKIDIFLGETQRLATLDLELPAARELVLEVGEAVKEEEQKDAG